MLKVMWLETVILANVTDRCMHLSLPIGARASLQNRVIEEDHRDYESTCIMSFNGNFRILRACFCNV